MNEIARVDPNLLDDSSSTYNKQYSSKLSETTPKNIIKLREIFTEELIKVHQNLQTKILGLQIITHLQNFKTI